jgi:hypothetical protein
MRPIACSAITWFFVLRVSRRISWVTRPTDRSKSAAWSFDSEYSGTLRNDEFSRGGSRLNDDQSRSD